MSVSVGEVGFILDFWLGEEVMVEVVVVWVSMPTHVNESVTSRGVWGFLDLLRLVLTQSGRKFHYSIYSYY